MDAQKKQAVVIAVAALVVAAAFSYVLVARPFGSSSSLDSSSSAPSDDDVTNASEFITADSVPAASPEPVDVNERHDYSSAARDHVFDIPNATNLLHFRIYFENSVGPSQDKSIIVLDPNGVEWARTSTSSANVAVAVGGRSQVVERTDVHMMPGAWTVRFTGSGLSTGVLEITG